MSKERSRPFAPTIYEPEKRLNKYTLRLTDSENEILEREAARNGLTPLNMIRSILSARLLPSRKPKR